MDFEKNINGNDIYLMITEIEDNNYDISFDCNDSYEAANIGVSFAFRVMDFVVEICNKIKQQNPKATFRYNCENTDGKGYKRKSLYERIVKKNNAEHLITNVTVE